MQQLDKELDCSLASPTYVIVGGRLSDITRMSSYFGGIPERCRRCQRRIKTFPTPADESGETGLAVTHFSSVASMDDKRTCNCGMEAEVLSWNQEKVDAWLEECGFGEYKVCSSCNSIAI